MSPQHHQYTAIFGNESSESEPPAAASGKKFGKLILDAQFRSTIANSIVLYIAIIMYYCLRHTRYKLDEPWTRAGVDLARWCSLIGLFHTIPAMVASGFLHKQPVFSKGLRGSTILAFYTPLIWCSFGIIALLTTCILYAHNWDNVNGPPRGKDDPTVSYVAQVSDNVGDVLFILTFVSIGSCIVNYTIYGRAGRVNLTVNPRDIERC